MKKFTNIDAIVLDMDYTLYDEYEYFYKVFEEFCHAYHFEDKLEQLKKDYFTLRPVSKNIFKEILDQNGIHSSRYSNDLFDIYTHINCMLSPYKDALHFIENIKNNTSIKLGLLTNGNVEAQANKVKSLNIAPYFDHIVYARSLGADLEKPNVVSFEYIKKQLAATGNRIVFIGDNPKMDFSGAKAVNGITYRLVRGLYKDIPSGSDVDMEFDDFSNLE